MIVGASNTGKTVYLVRPLKQLFGCAAGGVGQLNTQNQFVWADCLQKRLIICDEAAVSKIHVEQVKLIFAGEEAKVECKYDQLQTLAPTPVIGASNNVPWLYCPSEESALRNRMFLYNAVPVPDLRALHSDINPMAWVFFLYAASRSYVNGLFDADSFDCFADPEGAGSGWLDRLTAMKDEQFPMKEDNPFLGSTRPAGDTR